VISSMKYDQNKVIQSLVIKGTKWNSF